MSSAIPTGAILDLGSTFGCAYVGAMVAMILYGITTLQSYLYYMYYPKDKASLKWLVATLWVLETLQIAFVSHAMYHYLITNYANPEALGMGIWSLFISILCNLIISTIVQVFFAVRVHILSLKMWWLTILTMVTIVAHLAFGLETVIRMMMLKEFSELPTITYNSALPFALTAVFPDVIIAVSLCYFLHTVKSGFKGTNALLNTLIIYAINRCLLTSVVAIVEVILFKVIPGSFYFIAVDFCIGKLYANSLLATLNTRQVLRGRGSESVSLSPPSSRSAASPQFAVKAHGRGNDPVELSDLRATWPSGLGSESSGDTAPGLRSSIHRTRESADKEVLDIAVPVDINFETDTQQLALDDKPKRFDA